MILLEFLFLCVVVGIGMRIHEAVRIKELEKITRRRLDELK